MVTLRPAIQADGRFLYEVQRDAMRPVSAAEGPRVFDDDQAYAAYLTKFVPEEIQVIQYGGTDVGRLRVVRTPESIYIGGIQILPEYQQRGIGTEIFRALIQESSVSGIPITLEVHKVNAQARSFYEWLGFVEDSQTEEKIHLKFVAR